MDEERIHLIWLIHFKNCTVQTASRICKIPYDNAKIISRTYMLTNRLRVVRKRVSNRKRLPQLLVTLKLSGTEISDHNHAQKKLLTLKPRVIKIRKT